MNPISPPDDFNFSGLLIFAGIASTMLMNFELHKEFNRKNPFHIPAFFFILGTIAILLYGGSDGNCILSLRYSDININIPVINIGYYAILLGAILLLLINLVHVVKHFIDV